MRIRHLGSERGDIEYVYDGQSIIDELHNNSTSLVAHYRYGDRLLSLNSNGTDQFYHYASLGTTANLTNAQGEAQVAYRTDPFGEITQQEGESVNRHIFTGQEHDEKTGLIYFGARFYDPDTARFINQDTYLGESTTPPSLHRYLYAYANPTVYVDLDGFEAFRFDPNKTIWDPKTQTATQPDGKQYKPSFTKAVTRSKGLVLFAVLNSMGGDSFDPNNPKPPPDWLMVEVESAPAAPDLKRTHENAPGQLLNDEEFFREVNKAQNNEGNVDKSLAPTLTAESNNLNNGGNRAHEGNVQRGGNSVADIADDQGGNNSSQIHKNRLAGDEFHRKVLEMLKNNGQNLNIQEEVTIETGSGVRTRIDIITSDSEGVIRCFECKGSETAPLTKGQKNSHPEIESTGGLIKGKGKPGFEGGTKIPPTTVEIIRPENIDKLE